MKGQPSADILKKALDKLNESRVYMDTLYNKIEELRTINNSNETLPEYKAALRKILKDHPPLERVSLTDMRFANIARGKKPVENKKSIGSNLDEILVNIQRDLSLLRQQLDQTIAAFREVIPVAEKGGFAAMVLSGRAPLPEKIMQSTDLMVVFAQFYNRACQTTIAADMQVYPKGLEWLPPPSKKWTPKD